jgi:ribosome-binding protein aMBF1 (putative translation factor)
MFKAPVVFVVVILLASIFRFQSINGSNTKQVYTATVCSTIPLGETIRQARQKKTLTEKDLAEAVGHGITATNIEKIEKGLAYPTHEVLAKMQKILEVPLAANR